MTQTYQLSGDMRGTYVFPSETIKAIRRDETTQHKQARQAQRSEDTLESGNLTYIHREQD